MYFLLKLILLIKIIDSIPFNQYQKSESNISIIQKDLDTELNQENESQKEFKKELIEIISSKSTKSEVKLRNAGTNIGIANDVSKACLIQ